MRVDFSTLQTRANEEMQLLRLMRAVHAMAASVVVTVTLMFAYSLPGSEREWVEASAGREYSAVTSRRDAPEFEPGALDPALSVIDGVTQHG